MSEPCLRENIVSLGEYLCWCIEQYASIGTQDVNLIEVLGATLTNANPVIAGIFDAAGNRMPAGDAPARQLYTEDSGANTNPERWLHENHWEADEVTVAGAGAGGEQNLGAVVGGGVTRRIREITVRHAGTNNTVVTILISGGATKFTIDVPAQTTRVWSSQDGAEFDPTEQSAVQTSDVTGGSTFVSARGVET